MDIDIVIEIDKIPPYDKAPFDPYQDTISVSEDTYSKVIDYCKKGIFVLQDMNIPELIPIIEEWEEDVKDETSERFSFSDAEDFIEPIVTIKVDEYFFEENK